MLTTQQRRQFEKKLSDELQEVSRRLAYHRCETSDEEIASQREPATSTSELINEHLTSSEENLIAKITFAMTRLEDGTYDQCSECGKPISLERLNAKPSASRCIACQSKHDPRR